MAYQGMFFFFSTMRVRDPENVDYSTPHGLLPAPADGARMSNETTAVVLGGEMTCDGCLLFAAWCCSARREIAETTAVPVVANNCIRNKPRSSFLSQHFSQPSRTTRFAGCCQ